MAYKKKLNIPEDLPQDKKTLYGILDPKYRDFALNAQENKLNCRVYNSNMLHAIFLSEFLISQAKDSIKIFSGSIAELFFNNNIIKKAFEDKLNEKKNIKISVVVQEYEGTPDWMKNKNIEIRRLDKSNITIQNHMMLIDNNAFRIEKLHPINMFKGNKELNVIAEVNFNNKDVAGIWNKIYDTTIYKNSTSTNIG